MTTLSKELDIKNEAIKQILSAFEANNLILNIYYITIEITVVGGFVSFLDN